jgi:hypothetical protein
MISAAAPGPAQRPGTEFPNAVPYLLDQHAVRRAADALQTLTPPMAPEPGPRHDRG